MFQVLSAFASFIVESFALHPEFSIFPSSLQAAAATHLAVSTLDPNFAHWDLLKCYPGYYTIYEMHTLQIRMVQSVKEQQNPACQCRETYTKYSTPEFSSVSVIYGDQFAEY